MGISSKLNCQGGAKNSNVGGVKKYVDTAFDDVQKVANNLEKLLELNNTFQNLNGIYLGAYSTTPIVRTDGGALQNGDHYLNTDTSLLYVHLDGNWIYHSIFFTQSALNQAVAQGPYNIWIAYADDNLGAGISLNPDGKAYTGFANNQITDVVATNDASIFTWSKSIGVDGVTSHIHVAYADSSDGNTDFSFTTGSYLGVYVDTIPAASSDPALYNWNLIKGLDGANGALGSTGLNGTSVVVTDLGGGRVSISDGFSTVFLDDGEIPTLIDNGDGTYTITSGIESVTVSDGLTPLIGIDYFDGNNGDYISFVYVNVTKGDPAPTIDIGTGTWNGTVETYPTGAAWADNALFVEGQTTYFSQNRYMHDTVTDTWSLRNQDWAPPTIFIDKPDDASQGQIKSFAFLRSGTQPASAPSGGNFLSPNPTTGGWSDGIPSGSLPIWVVTAVFTSDGLTPQNAGDPVVWSDPQLLAENGQGFKHRFSANQTGPWSDIPATTDEWMITSVRDSSGIWVDDTSNPIRIKGETGASLQTQVRSFSFKRSSDVAFVETPVGGSFASPIPVDGAVTGWTDGIPTGTDRLYVSTRVFTSDGLTPHQISWAESQVFSYNGTGYRTRFSVNGIDGWHLEPTVTDVYMWPQTSDDGGLTWTDVGNPIKIKGESGFGSVELNFAPGLIGGSADFIFGLNAIATGTADDGSIRIQGSKFQHPDGTERTTETDTQVITPYGDSVAGKFYLMWSDESNVTRFSLSIGNATNIVPIRINTTNDGWEVFDNLGVAEAFTPLITDCIIATSTASATTGGLSSITPLVSGVAGAGGVGDVGASGNSVAQLTIYRRSATLPATPTGGSFSFDNLLITPPTDWSSAVVGGTDPLYASVGIASTTGTTGIDTGILWGAPDIISQDGATGSTGLQGLQGDAGTDGIAGVNNYFHIAYADDDIGTGFSQDPTGKIYIGTYVDDIIADAASGDALWNWQLAQGPNGANGAQGIQGVNGTNGETSYLHIAYANTATGSSGFSVSDSVNKSYIGQYTDFILADSTDPALYSWSLIRGTDGTDGDDGSNGTNGNDGITGTSVYQVNIYRRSATPPATPADNSASFNFTTNVLTPPVNWLSSIPAGTNPLYVSTAVFSITGDTGTDSTQTWTVPEIGFQDGDDGTDGTNGTNGLSTYMYNVFQRASSAPATPTGGSYNFGTNNGAPPSGWANNIASGTNPIYISSALASVTGATGTDSSLTWTTPVIFARDGVVGPPGEDGTNGSNGSNGNRGTKHYYTTTTAGGWSSTIANNFIIAQGDTKLTWDVVTISDSANGFAETRYWNGSAWITVGEVIDGNLIVIGTISGNKIEANSITTEHLSIATNFADADNESGLSIVFDPYSTSPMTMTREDGTNVFSIQLVDGKEKAIIDGTGGDNFINSINAINTDVRKALNKYYSGDGDFAIATTGVLQSSGTGAAISLTLGTGNNGIISLSYDFSTLLTSTNFTENYVVPVWTVRIRRNTSAGTIIHTATYTGAVKNTIPAYYLINCVGDFTDTNAPIDTNETYFIEILRVSGTPTQLTRNKFTASASAFVDNTFGNSVFGNAGGSNWVDKDTGFTIKYGSVFASAGETVVTFNESFTVLAGASATNSSFTGLTDYANIKTRSNASLTINSTGFGFYSVYWMAMGYTDI